MEKGQGMSGVSATEFAGAYAAAATPLTDDGLRIDTEAIPQLVSWLTVGGIHGILALGTTGEGVLLSEQERKDAAAAFIQGAPASLRVIVHCGAQSTRATAELASHAAAAGAAGVAVIAPPYYALDERSLLHHFSEAAQACAPLPFFVYEFAARSGYAVPVSVIEGLRDRAPNLVGLKVSDTPWERVEPYILPGLRVFVGTESLLKQALAVGAVGTVSALAAVLPELVAASFASPTDQLMVRLERVRGLVQRFPFQAALKYLLTRRGVPMTAAVRSPLRPLDAAERAAFDALLPELFSLAGVPEPAPV
jgi:dihydrodipicolinate synthase/N-acetylneuraminate lyase